MVNGSHDIKFIAKFDFVCSVTAGDNADGNIFRWVNLNTEIRCFFEGK